MAKKDSKKKVVAKKTSAKTTSPSKKADKKGTATKKTAPSKKATPKSKPAPKKASAVKKSPAPKVKPSKGKAISPASKKVVTKGKPAPVKKPVAKVTTKPVKEPKVVEKPKKEPKVVQPKVKEEPKVKRPVVQKTLAKPVTTKKPEIVVPKIAKPIQIDPKEKMGIKKQLLAKCLDIQTNIISTAKKAMDDAQQSANEEKNSNEEMTDSFRETMQATRDVYARQVQEGINTLGLLNRIMIKPLEIVKFGAVVVTDFQNYFISAGLGEVKIDDKNFVTVSTLTPLYQILSEKKKGDLFMFLDRKYRILDVF